MCDICTLVTNRQFSFRFSPPFSGLVVAEPGVHVIVPRLRPSYYNEGCVEFRCNRWYVV